MPKPPIRIYVGRPRGLAGMDVLPEHAKVLDKQVHLLVDYQLDRLTAYRPLVEQFKELARNAYLQGALEGILFVKKGDTT